MSSGKTEHYQLHLWEPEDTFVRVEFNENNQRVDAALAAKCEDAAFQSHKEAIDAAVASKADNGEFQAHKQAIDAAVASKADNGEFQAHKQSIQAAVASKVDSTVFQSHKQSIEAAVASKADNAAFQAHKQAMEAAVPGKCEVGIGAYVGNWTEAAPNQHIVLGRQPKAVIVWENRSRHSENLYRPYMGMAVTGCYGAGIEITPDGFTVRRGNDGGGALYPDLNFPNLSYMYLVIY